MIEAVADRFEGAPRQLRRRRSDDLKARAVAEALEPGSSVSAIARRLEIHPSQLFGWRRTAWVLARRAQTRAVTRRQDVSERLDVVPAKFRVIVTRRPKYAFKNEDGVIQATAPAHIIEVSANFPAPFAVARSDA